MCMFQIDFFYSSFTYFYIYRNRRRLRRPKLRKTREISISKEVVMIQL